jgi:hypothetical protein
MGAFSQVRPDPMGSGICGASPSAIREDLVELSRNQYAALRELTSAIGAMASADRLPPELEKPFRDVLTAFGV